MPDATRQQYTDAVATMDAPATRPCVLVVEDEKKTASFVRKALQAEGFAVDVCHNGNDALATALATPFARTFSLGVLPLLLFTTLRGFVAALMRTRAVFLVMVATFGT